MVKKVSPKKKIIRTFKGMRVVEAEADLLIVPNKADLACAVRGNAKECVFAQTCKRCFGSSEVEIFDWCAYVDLPDETGERFFKRFLIPPKTKAQIELYDSTGVLSTGGYLLRAPSAGRTLDAMADSKRLADTRTARIKGRRVVAEKKAAAIKKFVQRLASKKAAGIRSGSGLVKFDA
jgi:hypothetical protein